MPSTFLQVTSYAETEQEKLGKWENLSTLLIKVEGGSRQGPQTPGIIPVSEPSMEDQETKAVRSLRFIMKAPIVDA